MTMHKLLTARRLFFCWLVLAVALFGQFYGLPPGVRSGTVAAIPATCNIGNWYWATNATAGLNLYFCTAANVWTPIGTANPLYGGSAVGSIMEIDGTSNGAPVAAYLKLQTNGQATLIGCTGSPDSPVEIRNSTGCAATVAPTAGSFLHLVGANAANPRIYIDAFAGVPILNFRRADTTIAGPTAVQSAELLGQFGAQGYGATGYSATNQASIGFQASQTWTDSNHGAQIILQTTPNNTTTLLTALTINQDQSISVNGFESVGTKFTISGCTAGTTVGGATAGTFVSGTTGACTVVITMNGATGLTAPNGWVCAVNNLTTANLIRQSATSATTCTVTGVTVTSDVISFLAMAY